MLSALNRAIRGGLGLFLVLGLLVGLVIGQTKSRLTGTVTDSQGAVVAGAVITVKNDGTSQEVKATTSEPGTFNVPNLEVGVYTVTVAAPNFKQTVITP